MAVADQINARLTDLDSAIAAAQKRAVEEVARLQAQKALLQRALALVTPEAEQTLAALQSLGLVILK